VHTYKVSDHLSNNHMGRDAWRRIDQPCAGNLRQLLGASRHIFSSQIDKRGIDVVIGELGDILITRKFCPMSRIGLQELTDRSNNP
jgi:hypothetical protein